MAKYSLPKVIRLILIAEVALFVIGFVINQHRCHAAPSQNRARKEASAFSAGTNGGRRRPLNPNVPKAKQVRAKKIGCTAGLRKVKGVMLSTGGKKRAYVKNTGRKFGRGMKKTWRELNQSNSEHVALYPDYVDAYNIGHYN